MLNERESFRVGFIKACVDGGVAPDQITEFAKQANVMIKEAIPGAETLSRATGEVVDDAGNVVVNTLKGVGRLGTRLGLGGLILGPVAAGSALGFTAAGIRGLHDPDPDEIKAEEKLNAYRHAIAQAKARNEMRQRREGASRAVRPLI